MTLPNTDQPSERVLDPCCGSRMFWFDRSHKDVVYGDIRSEEHVLCDGRTLSIRPDMEVDFRDVPFKDGSFKLVVFDPPHLRQAGAKSWLGLKYGILSANWQDDVRRGFAECFRVLDTDGVLIFKWNETQVKVREVLALTPVAPLFGHPNGRKGLTHWMCFMKPATGANHE